MKTCFNYINKYSIYDDAIDAYESAIKDINMAIYEYEKSKREAMLSIYFEDGEEKTAAQKRAASEENGFFAKIGNSIIKFIDAVKKFITDFVNKIRGKFKKTRSDSEIVTSIIREHPELAKDISDGINNKWFTTKDVAKLEKDVIGLMNMLEQNKIDNKTYTQKMRESINNFNDSTTPFVKAGQNINNIVGLIPDFYSKIDNDTKSFKGITEKIKSVFTKRKDNKTLEEQMPDALKISMELGNTLMSYFNVTDENTEKIDRFIESWYTKHKHEDDKKNKKHKK